MDQAQDLINSNQYYRLTTISSIATVRETQNRMALDHARSACVYDSSDLVGIFSIRDLVKKSNLESSVLEALHVSNVMTKEVVFTDPKTDLMSCFFLMTDARIHNLPIIEGTNVLGSISIKDVVIALIDSRDFYISRMSDYISGTY